MFYFIGIGAESNAPGYSCKFDTYLGFKLFGSRDFSLIMILLLLVIEVGSKILIKVCWLLSGIGETIFSTSLLVLFFLGLDRSAPLKYLTSSSF